MINKVLTFFKLKPSPAVEAFKFMSDAGYIPPTPTEKTERLNAAKEMQGLVAMHELTETLIWKPDTFVERVFPDIIKDFRSWAAMGQTSRALGFGRWGTYINKPPEKNYEECMAALKQKLIDEGFKITEPSLEDREDHIIWNVSWEEGCS